MRKYEIMLILPAEVEEETVGGVIDRIARVLGERGGEVTKADRWGRRRFAHGIEKRSEGYYVIVECTSDPTVVRELERVLTLADDVVRFKVVVRGDVTGAPAAEAPAQAAPAQSEPVEPPSEPEPAPEEPAPEESAPEETAPEESAEPAPEADPVAR